MFGLKIFMDLCPGFEPSSRKWSSIFVSTPWVEYVQYITAWTGVCT